MKTIARVAGLLSAIASFVAAVFYYINGNSDAALWAVLTFLWAAAYAVEVN